MAVSTYTIRQLVKALMYLEPRQTALLRGRHGIGKSAVAYAMARKWGLNRVIERRISQLSEGDMIGLPDRSAVRSLTSDQAGQEHIMLSEFDEKANSFRVTKFLPTDWFMDAMVEPVLVFLDEINRGTPEVQNACFEFVEKGRLNGQEIHPGSRIIAAVNFSKEYNVNPMDPAFIDRFWVADLEPDKIDFMKWGRSSDGMTPEEIETFGNQHICDEVLDFINQCNDDDFEIHPEKQSQMDPTEITPSRRSWEKVSRHLSRKRAQGRLIEADASIIHNVVRGFVGTPATRNFTKFLKENNRIVTPEEVMADVSKCEDRIKKLKPEECVALVDKIETYIKSNNVDLTSEQAKNLATCLRLLPDEIGVTMFSKIINSGHGNAATFHKEAGKNFLAMLAKTKMGEQLSDLAGLKKS